MQMRLTCFTFLFGLTMATAWAEMRGAHRELLDQSCRDLGQNVMDEGCSETTPVCVDANGREVTGGNAGHHCAYCTNSRQPNGIDQVGPDEGCDEVSRVCMSDRKLKKANEEGTTCAVCINSRPADKNPKKIDDGCPPTAPVCVNDVGNRPKSWTPGTACVAKCFDTSVSGADKGVRYYYCCVR